VTDNLATNSQGQETPVSTGVASAQVEGDETNSAETEQAEGEETEGTQETEEELDDLEHEGKKYRVPKALKPGWMLQADYTRKTQELAEQRKALETRASQQANSDTDRIRAVGKIMAMDEQISQFEKFDWNSVPPEKAVEANAAMMEYQKLKMARDRALGELQQKDQQRQSEAQRESAKRTEELRAALPKEIPGWDTGERDKLFAFSTKDLGLTADELDSISDVKLVKVLHRAYLGDQAIKKLAAIERAKASEDARPVQTVGSNAGANARRTTDASGDKLTTEAWMKLERARLTKR
jgi:hypothetical protein